MIRRTSVVLLDVLAATLSAIAVAAAMTGGFTLRAAGIRLSVQTPTRALVVLGVVLLVRAIWFRTLAPLGIPSVHWRRFVSLRSDDPVVPNISSGGRWKRTAVASALLAVAVALVLHDQVLRPFAVPDWGDPLFSIWRMGWVTHSLASDPAHLFDGNIFHPLPLTLTFSDPIIVPALLGAPLRIAGVHPVLVYNLLIVSAFWLSGVATYLLVERLTGSSRAAFVAGLIYATYSYRFDHYSHLELQMTYWMPFGLLALHRFISTARWRYALSLALAGVAQLYSGMYYSVFFLVYVAVIATGLLIAQRPSLRTLIVPGVAAAVVAAVLAVPIVRAFTAAESQKGERTVEEIQYFSAQPVDYLRANPSSVLWKDRLLPGLPERAMFPGAAPLALGALALVPPFSTMRLVYAAGLFLAVDGSFGLNGFVYPHLYRWLSPFRGMRSPARFGALVGLTLAILAGFAVRRVLQRCPSLMLQRAVLTIAIAAVLLDAWPAINLVPVWRDPPPVYEAAGSAPGVVLAEFPVRPDPAFNATFMYFSLWHWLPMINGYSGFIPQSWAAISPQLENFPLGQSIDLLRERGVTHVTVNCGVRFIGNDDCETIFSRVRATAGLSLVSDARWEGARVALYKVTPAR